MTIHLNGLSNGWWFLSCTQDQVMSIVKLINNVHVILSVQKTEYKMQPKSHKAARWQFVKTLVI
jgi:hypothetical protein